MTDEEARQWAVKVMADIKAQPATTSLPAIATQGVELQKGFLGGGILDKIPKVEVLGMPLGDGLKGAAILGVSDVIAGFKDVVDKDGKIPGWAIPIGVAFVLNIKFVRDFLGQGTVDFGKRLLAVEAIQGAVDVRGKVRDFLGGFLPKPKAPPAAPARAQNVPNALPPGPTNRNVPTRSQGTGDRYARAF